MASATPWTEMRSERRLLRAALWVVQIALAALFGTIGVMALTWPVPDVAAAMQWPALVPDLLVRFIGAANLLGAIGLVVPAATRIQPQLTWMAAGGILLMMICAVLFHASVLDFRPLPLQCLLAGLAWFVAWGRWKAAPIAPRYGAVE